MVTRIRGEVYEIRCGKCDTPSTMEKCPHAYGDLQFCSCCSKCRALCYEMGDDMFDVHPCTVEEDMRKALEVHEHMEDIRRALRGDRNFSEKIFKD